MQIKFYKAHQAKKMTRRRCGGENIIRETKKKSIEVSMDLTYYF
jgi:hypothetical protein